MNEKFAFEPSAKTTPAPTLCCVLPSVSTDAVLYFVMGSGLLVVVVANSYRCGLFIYVSVLALGSSMLVALMFGPEQQMAAFGRWHRELIKSWLA